MAAFALSATPTRRWRRAPTCSTRRPPKAAAHREDTLHSARALLSQLHEQHEHLQNTRQVTTQQRQLVNDFQAFLRQHGSEIPHLQQQLGSVDDLLLIMDVDGVLAEKVLEVIREPVVTASVVQRDNNAMQTAARALIQKQQQQQQQDETRSGLLWRRNAYWMAIPMQYARSHEYIAALPAVASQSFNDVKTLRRLRHDSEAFHAASCLSYMRAADVWTYLGFAERLGSHSLSLEAWKRSVRKEVRRQSFVQRFQLARRANALLLYAEECRRRWTQRIGDGLSSAHAVRLFEQGLYMADGDLRGFVSTPSAFVRQRSENDYWMWEPKLRKVLLVHAMPAFRTSVRPYCRCEPQGAPTRLPVRTYVEAQFTMACCDMTSADVLLYGTLQASRVFEVRRDERFLKEAVCMCRWYERQFLARVTPPEERFHRRYERFSSVWRLADEGVAAATVALDVDALEAETLLAPSRARLNDWELQHSAHPFRRDG